MLQFSSGSTGRSKRVARTHRNLAREAEMLSATTGLGPEDRILCAVPLFHTYGLGNCLLAPLRVGASSLLVEKFQRQEVLETLARATVFPGVPFIFGILGDSAGPKGLDLSSLRLCMSAGAPLPRETFERFRARYGVVIRQQYGSTETGCVAINLAADPEPESVGPPIRDVELRIVPREGSEGAPGAGEVAVRSPAMAEAYFGNEALTRERFRDGYLLTGDLGWRDAQGHLRLSGRSKIFINTATHKVDPSEVEALIRTHEKVAEVVVLGVPGSYGAEVVKAVVIPKAACGEGEIVDHCRGRLADYKLPRIVEFREELPRSPLGKVLKKYLSDPL
jgi:long-chain acyl-CoA synthetase